MSIYMWSLVCFGSGPFLAEVGAVWGGGDDAGCVDAAYLMQAARLLNKRVQYMDSAIPPSNRQDIAISSVSLPPPIALCCPRVSLSHTSHLFSPRALVQPITPSDCTEACNLRPYDVQALLTSRILQHLSILANTHA
jgi:hypothetical protein